MVEDVEGLDVEFEGEVLVYGEDAVDRGVEIPEVLSRDKVAWGVAEGSDGWGFEGAGIEPLVTGLGEAGGCGAGGVSVDGAGAEGIADEIGTLVGSGVAGVGDVAGCGDVNMLAGASGDDAVDLPVADDVITLAGAGGEALVLAEGKLVDDVGGEDLGDVEAGWAAAAAWVVGVFGDSAFDAEVAVGAFVEGLGPGVGDGVAEAGAEAAEERCLQSVIGGAAAGVVP